MVIKGISKIINTTNKLEKRLSDCEIVAKDRSLFLLKIEIFGQENVNS